MRGGKNIGFVDEFIDATKDWHIDDLDKIMLKFENSEYRREILSGDKSNRWKRGSSDYESCNPDVL